MPQSTPSAAGVTPEQFRDVIGRFATGVTVITTMEDGRWLGTTASAVSSLSLEPPMLLVCMNRGSSTGAAISRTGSFAVNILAEGHDQLARRFARKDPDKFRGVAVTPGRHGHPLLDGALGHVECRVAEQVLGGTHTVFLAEVESASGRPGTPLAYFRGQFGRLALAPDEQLVPPAVGLTEDALRARVTMQLGAAVLTVGRLSQEQLAELRGHMEATIPRRPDGEAMRHHEWFEADQTFHEYLLRAVGSEALIAAHRRFTIPGVTNGSPVPDDAVSEDAAAEHIAIVEGYEASDLQAACEAIRRDNDYGMFHRARLARTGGLI